MTTTEALARVRAFDVQHEAEALLAFLDALPEDVQRSFTDAEMNYISAKADGATMILQTAAVPEPALLR